MKLLKKTSYLFTIILLLSISLACSSDDDSNPNPTPTGPSNSANIIMPLGASRVAGARPEYESYRYELWKLLIDGGYDFDFIGTETDNASYPDFNGMSFDRNHEGRGGINSTEILAELGIWLNDLSSVPDIVLFSSPGGNDGIDQYAQTLINVNAIIDLLQERNPNVTIYLELPAPPMTSEQTPEFMDYYNQALMDIPVVAQQQSTSTSSVLTVDMATGFIDAYLEDDVHYNEAGAAFIAGRYYDELINILQ
ncbi:hypothetical protein [uncultured Winogradskyella sp.]|uniref:SGNH/GDSL hydrolase family protein n=1 Tax=uncultured Winogradskyella sp. TaxID=395353 RepID=UPI0026063125|nr:hypothetical protein [uncultured Winogradskyella sp.]